jgi:hypothetical protein
METRVVSIPKEHRSRAPARRNPDRMLCDFGRHLGWHGRTRQVNGELERRLGGLDGFAWHIERDLRICSVPIPFVLLGPGGLFLLQASRGQWTAEDLDLMSRAARTLARTLADYPDEAHPAIVMLEDDQPPRQHFTAAGEGPCWILGDDWLSRWLDRFCDHGLSEADIAVLRDHSDPARICERQRVLRPRGEG